MLDLQGELSRHYGSHRSGWAYAVRALSSLHDEAAPQLISFIEKKFIFGSEEGDFKKAYQPPQKEWVGFLHVPANVPVWFNPDYSPERLFNTQHFKEALTRCVGIFTLSSPLAEWVQKRFDGPVDTVLHPTHFPLQEFDSSCLSAGKSLRVVQLGFWLRKLCAIHELMLPSKNFDKLIVGAGQPRQKITASLERRLRGIDCYDSDVRTVGFLSNDKYDDLLCSSVVFIDFYDTSANNAVVECIARGTPIVCPPSKAVMDYLGPDYPLYFQNYQQARDLLNDRQALLDGHNYLLDRNLRKRLSIESFVKSVSGSYILN